MKNDKRKTSISISKDFMEMIDAIKENPNIKKFCDHYNMIILIAIKRSIWKHKIYTTELLIPNQRRTTKDKREEEAQKYTTSFESIKDRVEKNYDKKECKISIVISENLLMEIITIYHTENTKNFEGYSYAISCCILELYEDLLPIINTSFQRDEICLFHRPGLKNGNTLDMVTRSIEEIQNTHNCNFYIEPFAGALGVYSDSKINFKKVHLNDLEMDMINLLKVLKHWNKDFIKTLLCYPVNGHTFDVFKKELKEEKLFEENFEVIDKVIKRELKEEDNKTKNELIDRAVKYYYVTRFSWRGNKNDSYKNNVTEEKLFSNLDNLIDLTKKLKNANITRKDVFEFLNKIIEWEKSKLAEYIIYLDPPYIGTEDYYKNSSFNKDNFHEMLKKLLVKLKNRGAKIILSYRATTTLSNKKTNSTEVQRKLDNLYMSQGFFIQFEKINYDTNVKGKLVSDNQIEILLTSEQVSKSIPYNRNIADLIKKHVK